MPRRLTTAGKKSVDPSKPPLRAATHMVVPENILVLSRRRWVRTFAGLTSAAVAFVVGDLMVGLCPLGPKIADKINPLIDKIHHHATVGQYSGWIALGLGVALLITLMCIAAKRFWWPLIPAVLLAGGAFVAGVATIGEEGSGGGAWKERAEKAEAKQADLQKHAQEEHERTEGLQRSLDERTAEVEKMKKRVETAEAQIQPYERTMMDLMKQKKQLEEENAELKKRLGEPK